uniref:Monoglyceride lipase n=1 Tax=Paramormyrops kingsleyae TaxID=1676925 RepID=A0A3B3SX25_9TELE|nr:monoglyceride lipase isoform X1 [Paramormyrops kingsleyae]
MNAALSCLLFAVIAYMYSDDLLSALRGYVAERILGAKMPDPGEDRRSPQGVPYSDLRHFVNADGQHLFCRYWEPEGPPRALVFVVHGAAEHCGSYDDVAQTLMKRNLLVFAHDHVGHGKSEGKRLVVRDFQVYIRDATQHVAIMKKRYPGLPIFLLGHSMGGAISILTACEQPEDFAGVVLIAPLVQTNPESATPFKVFLAKCLFHILPSLPLGSLDSKWVSRNMKQVEAYDNDELVYRGGLPVSFVMHILNATERINKAIPTIKWPFLLLHGDHDKLCDIGGSQIMYEKALSTDKKLKVFDGAYHALHHELPELADLVLKEIGIWVEERIPPQPLADS